MPYNMQVSKSGNALLAARSAGNRLFVRNGDTYVPSLFLTGLLSPNGRMVVSGSAIFESSDDQWTNVTTTTLSSINPEFNSNGQDQVFYATAISEDNTRIMFMRRGVLASFRLLVKVNNSWMWDGSTITRSFPGNSQNSLTTFPFSGMFSTDGNLFFQSHSTGNNIAMGSIRPEFTTLITVTPLETSPSGVTINDISSVTGNSELKAATTLQFLDNNNALSYVRGSTTVLRHLTKVDNDWVVTKWLSSTSLAQDGNNLNVYFRNNWPEPANPWFDPIKFCFPNNVNRLVHRAGSFIVASAWNGTNNRTLIRNIPANDPNNSGSIIAPIGEDEVVTWVNGTYRVFKLNL